MTESQADAATERERELAAQVERGERQVKDLRSQVAGLEMSDLGGEVVFQHIRTRRNLVTIYSVLDGEPISIPEYMVAGVLGKALPDGSPMFSEHAEDAPEYKRGQVKCFLHPDSPDRPILERAGLAGKTCVAGNLAGGYAKRIHGQHRHKQEWEAYQDYANSVQSAAVTGRAEQQLEATLAIARRIGDNGSAESVSQEPVTSTPSAPTEVDAQPQATPIASGGCDQCDWKPKAGTKDPAMALRFHVAGKHV